MTPEQKTGPRNFRCSYPGCTREAHDGYAILRTSPKGQPFAGMCLKHIRLTDHEDDPAVRRIVSAIEESNG